MLKKFIEIGKIVGTHGIKGEMRVQPWSDSTEFLSQFKKVYLDSEGNGCLDVAIRPHGNVALMKADSISTIEEAEKLRNKIIYINRNDASIKTGRYFIQDIIGCTAYDADNGKIYGKVTDIFSTGANDVWQISDNSKEYLIPAVPEFIVSVEPEIDKVTIRPLKGIFDNEN